MDKLYIKLIPNADKQPGDNRPSFVAPINPKSPPGKTWRLSANVNGVWYNQAAFDDTEEDGTPTGGLNVVLTPQDNAQSGPTGGGKQQSFTGYKKPFKRKSRRKSSTYNFPHFLCWETRYRNLIFPNLKAQLKSKEVIENVHKYWKIKVVNKDVPLPFDFFSIRFVSFISN